MYRVLSTQKCNIYCEEDRCNLECGYFHKPDLKQTVNKPLRDRRPKFRVQSLDMGGESTPNGEKKGSAGSNGKRQYLNIQPNAIEPITPLTGGSSTVTLDEIIASAKRKISQEFLDLRIPSPILLEESDVEMKHLAKQRNLIGGTPWPKDVYQSDEDDHKEDVSYVEHLVDSSDDDDVWFNQDPPSVIEDGDKEDFDELLKVTQPPTDHYSNPLYRNADNLTRDRRKNLDFDDNSSVSLSIADISESQLDWDLNFALIQTRLTDGKVEYEGNL